MLVSGIARCAMSMVLVAAGLTAGAGAASAQMNTCDPVQGVEFTDVASLQAALDAAAADDSCVAATVTFTNGLTWADGDSELSWTAGKDLTLRTNPDLLPTLAVLDAASESRVLNSSAGAGVIIQNMEITGGRVESGGGVIGAGIYSTGQLEISGSQIVGNSLVSMGDIAAGAGIYASQNLTLTDSVVEGNSISAGTEGSGGGIYAAGEVNASGSQVSQNVINAGKIAEGAGMFAGGNTSFSDGQIVNNTAYTIDSDSGVTFAGARVNQTLTLVRASVTGNEATSDSTSGDLAVGGVQAGGGISATNSTFANNSASSVGSNFGGLHTANNMDLKFTTVADNTVSSGSVTSIGVGVDFTTIGSVIGSATGTACTIGGTRTSSYNATVAGDTSCVAPGEVGHVNLSSWADAELSNLTDLGSTLGMVPQGSSPLIGAVPVDDGQAAIGPNAVDQRLATREGDFWIGAVQASVVTFDGNGSTGGTMDPQVAAAQTNLMPNAFTRTGYTFTGWNTAADGSGTNYANEAPYAFDADVTLFALWLQNGGGGKQPQTANCSVFTSAPVPPSGIKALTRGDCETSADQLVGTRMQFRVPRGDVTTPRLACRVAGKLRPAKRLPRKYGARAFYCRTGTLVAVTNRQRGRYLITWTAPATPNFRAYRKTAAFRIR